MGTSREGPEQELTRLRRQREELAAANTRLQRLIAAGPAVTYVAATDAGHGFTYVSDNIRLLLGHAPADFGADPSFWKRRLHPDDHARLFDATGALKAHQQLLETGSAAHEYRFRHHDGSYRWLRDEMHLVRDAAGEPLEIIGHWSDISAQKQLQDRLRRERNTAQRYLDTVEAIIVALDRNGTVTLLNRKGCELFCREPGEMIGRNWFDSCLPEGGEKAAVIDTFNAIMAGRLAGHEYYENWVRTRGGEARLIAWHNSYLTDDEGRRIGTLSAGNDITERARYAKALHHLAEGTSRATGDEFFRQLVRHLSQALGMRFALIGQLCGAQADRIGTLAVWADGDFADNFEYPLATSPITGLCTHAVCCYPQDLGRLFPNDRLLSRVAASSYVSEPLLSSSGQPLGIIAVMHDGPVITTDLAQSVLSAFAGRAAAEIERLKAEQDIRNIKDRLIEAQRLAHIGNWNWIIEGDDLWWSDEVYRIFGAAAQDFECSYQSFLGFVHPDDRARLLQAVEEALTTGQPYSIEHRILRPDGQIRHCHERGEVVRDADGQAVRMFGTVQDLTEIKQAGASLAATERQLEQALLLKEKIMEESPIGIAIYDAGGQCIAANAAMGQLIGATREQVLAQNYHSITSFRASGLYEKILAAIERQRIERMEISTTSSFGKPVELNCHLAPFCAEGSHYLLLMVDDLSELRRAKRKADQLLLQNRNLTQCLFSAQEAERKLLARELHDELGQWLTVIQLNTQLISELNDGASTDIDDCAHTIATSAGNIHQGIRNMIQSLRPALLDELGLSESLQAMTAQWQQHHPDIACRLSLEDGLDGCREDVAVTSYRLIQEALNNVAKHAQASEVTIALHREHTPQSPTGWLRIGISDNGVGLPPDCQGKGMGLTWMRERVLAAGGDFFLDNLPGGGLKISVCLPLHFDYAI